MRLDHWIYELVLVDEDVILIHVHVVLCTLVRTFYYRVFSLT